jgi:UDP-N-acetyl-D-mannosaminuronate dehydrogenase
MPEYVVTRIADALNSVRKPINGSTVHLFGVAYKRDVNDVRESPALDVLELLVKRGAVVSYTDPHVPRLEHGGQTWTTVPFETAVKTPGDCAVVATDHTEFDYARIAQLPLVVDTRNALKASPGHQSSRCSPRTTLTTTIARVLERRRERVRADRRVSHLRRDWAVLSLRLRRMSLTWR